MKNEFYDSLCKEERRLLDLLNAVRLLKGNYEGSISIASDDPFIGNGSTLIASGSGRTTSYIKTKVPKKIKDGDKPYFDSFDFTPSEYSKDFTQIQKTIFVLRSGPEGFTEELTERLLRYDSIPFEKAKAFITYHCSKLYNLGLIGARKIGNKNKYFINDNWLKKQVTEMLKQKE